MHYLRLTLRSSPVSHSVVKLLCRGLEVVIKTVFFFLKQVHRICFVISVSLLKETQRENENKSRAWKLVELLFWCVIT